MAISSKDVAKVVRRSYSTLNGALNGMPRLKSETKAPIPRATAEMGCVPSGNLMIRQIHTLAVPPGAAGAPHCPLLLQRPSHAWRCAHNASLRIPHDVPAPGSDELGLAPFFLEPPLTTVTELECDQSQAKKHNREPHS